MPAISVQAMRAANHPQRKGGEQRSRRPTRGKQDIVIRLSDEQVGEVLREVSGSEGLHGFLLARVDELDQIRINLKNDPLFTDPKFSQSLLRGLAILRALLPAGSERGVNEIAYELGLNPSTAHRYVATLREAGIVEQSRSTHQYRLAVGPDVAP